MLQQCTFYAKVGQYSISSLSSATHVQAPPKMGLSLVGLQRCQ